MLFKVISSVATAQYDERHAEQELTRMNESVLQKKVINP